MGSSPTASASQSPGTPTAERPGLQLSMFMARYANWHRDQLERLVSVGSNPTRATRSWIARVVFLTAACKAVAIKL